MTLLNKRLLVLLTASIFTLCSVSSWGDPVSPPHTIASDLHVEGGVRVDNGLDLAIGSLAIFSDEALYEAGSPPEITLGNNPSGDPFFSLFEGSISDPISKGLLLDPANTSANFQNLNVSVSGSLSLNNSPVITAESLAGRISTLPAITNDHAGIKAGYLNWTSGYSFGPATKADYAGAVAIGFNTEASNTAAFASGYHSKALGLRSSAFGHASTAYGNDTMATGWGTHAYGHVNFVGGWGSTTRNYNSFAFGHGCKADSNQEGAGFEGDSFAIAIGSFATADAEHSIAIGYGATSTAPFANSWGRSLWANTMHEHNVGSCANISVHNSGWSETDPIYRLGNSPDWALRSDAITVLKNGETYLINKAWNRRPTGTSPIADPSPATDDSSGNALTVNGHTVT